MFVATLERAAAFLLAITSIQIHLALGQLVMLSECVCPGRELRLECTVVGGFSTAWKGTAFNCPGPGNQTLLRHSLFNQSGGAVRECNNGMIIGRSRTSNRTFDGLNFVYTSQLIIHLPSLNATNNTLEGRTVQCVHDGVTVIGNHTIAYTRISSAPPPDNVHLAQVSRHVLTFQWVPVQLVCSDIIEYKVNATNCGLCPDTTFNTSVTCLVRNTDLLTSTSNTIDTLCTLSVETTVCGFQSNMSESATAMLKAPGRPTINKVLPYYNFTSRQLTKIDIQIESDSNEERFYISNGTDGSIISYAFDISFSDSDSNCTSPITTLPVSFCVDGVCNITLANLTSLPCYKYPSQAEVAVYASNVLTDGPPSTTSLLNTSNSLFFVIYEPLSNGFSCVFVGSYENKSCEITYGAMDPTDQTCPLDNQAARHVNSSGSLMLDTVTVFIPPLAQAKPAIYCFTAIGKTPYFTIAVEGTFIIGTVTSGNSNTTVILIATISAICCVIIVLLLASIIAALSRIISKKKHTLKQREYTDQDEQQYDRTTFAQRQLRQVPPTHSEQTDEQQYDQSSFAQQQLPSTHLDQAEEQQYDLIFIQKQSKQPIASQQMVYSKLGPTVTGRKTSNFVLGIDDRIEYAELDHRPHGHAVLSSDTATTCLAEPETDNFATIQEDSPPPPPLPPKYTMM